MNRDQERLDGEIILAGLHAAISESIEAERLARFHPSPGNDYRYVMAMADEARWHDQCSAHRRLLERRRIGAWDVTP